MRDAKNSFRFLGGVIHNDEDLNKKWSKSIVCLYSAPLDMECVAYIDEGGSSFYFTNLDDGENYSTEAEHLLLVREFPPIGVFKVKDSIFYITRQSARQFKRGCNAETIEIDVLYKGKGSSTWQQQVCRAFKREHISLEEALQNCKEGNPIVLTNHLWIVNRDGYLLSLYHDDIFIGLLNQDKQFIPHSETFTLAEEAINELGLQPI